MRVYYIFLLKEETIKQSKKDLESLYKLLEIIYYLKKEEIKIGYRLFNKVCTTFNKRYINKLIKEKNIDNLSYTLYLNKHIINNFFNEENSKLEVHTCYLKLTTNTLMPSFFDSFKNIDNIFVCDFNNKDYFILKELIMYIKS